MEKSTEEKIVCEPNTERSFQRQDPESEKVDQPAEIDNQTIQCIEAF